LRIPRLVFFAGKHFGTGGSRSMLHRISSPIYTRNHPIYGVLSSTPGCIPGTISPCRQIPFAYR
jgi:hypothetical protein